MKIGLDFDGVISDCGKLKSDVARMLYGLDIPPSRFKKELLIESGLMTAEQYRKLQILIYGTREYGFLMEPVAGVLQYLPRLIAEGHFPLVITSRFSEELSIAEEWASSHNLPLEFVGVGYGESKKEAAQEMDVYIDDDLDKLEPLVGVVPNLFLFSWGYNEHIKETGICERVSSWEAFYHRLQRLR